MRPAKRRGVRVVWVPSGPLPPARAEMDWLGEITAQTGKWTQEQGAAVTGALTEAGKWTEQQAANVGGAVSSAVPDSVNLGRICQCRVDLARAAGPARCSDSLPSGPRPPWRACVPGAAGFIKVAVTSEAASAAREVSASDQSSLRFSRALSLPPQALLLLTQTCSFHRLRAAGDTERAQAAAPCFLTLVFARTKEAAGARQEGRRRSREMQPAGRGNRGENCRASASVLSGVHKTATERLTSFENRQKLHNLVSELQKIRRTALLKHPNFAGEQQVSVGL